MRRAILFLLITSTCLEQACFSWQKTRVLATCRPSDPGKVVCIIKVPKTNVGVRLLLKVENASEPKNAVYPELLIIRIRNEEPHEIQLRGRKEGSIYLRPSESADLPVREALSGLYPICSFDTSTGTIRLRIELQEPTLTSSSVSVRILAETSDSL